MKKLSLCVYLGFIFASFNASAARIKVLKVKGQRALIEINGKVEAGESYNVIADEQSSSSLRTGPRDHRLGINLNFNAFKTKWTASADSSPSNFTMSGDYGWVKGHHEGGPVLGYISDASDFSGTTTTFLVGGYYDYNLDENKEPTTSLFGGGFRATYSSISVSTGLSGLSAVELYPNGFWKWFPFGQSTALRLDLGYYYLNRKDSSSSEHTTTGVKSTGSLLFYY